MVYGTLTVDTLLIHTCAEVSIRAISACLDATDNY